MWAAAETAEAGGFRSTEQEGREEGAGAGASQMGDAESASRIHGSPHYLPSYRKKLRTGQRTLLQIGASVPACAKEKRSHILCQADFHLLCTSESGERKTGQSAFPPPCTMEEHECAGGKRDEGGAEASDRRAITCRCFDPSQSGLCAIPLM